MSYATIADLKSRAGALGQAWHDNSEPTLTDVERLLDQVAGELDAFFGGSGYSVPLQDPVAQAALVGVNADKALLLAIDATYGGDHANVKELRASVKARVDAYDKAMADGKDDVLLYLGQTSEGAMKGGATDFWTVDGIEDYYWSLYAGRIGSWPWMTDPFGIPPAQTPAFRKGMRM